MNRSMDLRLVSYATCPFVQRAEFVLLYKALPHEITYIDLRDKPAWFLAISPRGKVPVLVVDEKAIFESQAICEFLEETHPLPPLMSQIPFYRARDRAFFTYVSEDIFPPVGALTRSADADAFASARGKLEERLLRLQEELGERSWLSGDGSRLGMVEVAIAPSFSRLALLARLGLYLPPPFAFRSARVGRTDTRGPGRAAVGSGRLGGAPPRQLAEKSRVDSRQCGRRT